MAKHSLACAVFVVQGDETLAINKVYRRMPALNLKPNPEVVNRKPRTDAFSGTLFMGQRQN